MNDIINIRSLKQVALKLEDPVKTLILSEPDIMSREEYLVKIQEWLRLLDLNLETKEKGSK